MSEDKKCWYVAYTVSRHEKKVEEKLNAMGIECFVATQDVIRKSGNRRRKVCRVVLPMVVFVHGTNKERLEALQLPSVTRYMMVPGEHKVATVPDEQMQRFRFMLDYSESAIEMADSPLEPGMIVKVIKGSLTGLQGELVQTNNASKVYVRIDMLGCAAVEVPIGFVEPVRTHSRNGNGCA